ncbi:MAG: HD family phosphohydrolase [Lachnospiraceae bacterium]|nr:HD family phosphohydrolase [Lachnospiraceae bacterium]
MTTEEERQFRTMASPVSEDPKVTRMQDFIQHGNKSTYDHCMDVARTAFIINRRLHIGADEQKLVRASILHDYFLYDWHYKGDNLHGYHHPAIASRNAEADFHITRKEQKMIESHMWPLTFFHIPTSRGGWILTVADKICSSREVVKNRT